MEHELQLWGPRGSCHKVRELVGPVVGDHAIREQGLDEKHRETLRSPLNLKHTENALEPPQTACNLESVEDLQFRVQSQGLRTNRDDNVKGWIKAIPNNLEHQRAPDRPSVPALLRSRRARALATTGYAIGPKTVPEAQQPLMWTMGSRTMGSWPK